VDSLLLCHTDGSIVPKNPGGWAVGGWVIRDHRNILIATGTVDLGTLPTNTNNCSEYAAVEGLTSYLLDNSLTNRKIFIHSDSNLVIQQITGVWACNAPTLVKYWSRIQVNLGKFENYPEFVWIPREENKEADQVSRSLYPKKVKNGKRQSRQRSS